MFDLIYWWLLRVGSTELLAAIVSYAAVIMAVVITCLLVHFISEAIVKKALNRESMKSRHKWVEALLRHRVIHHAANILMPVTIAVFEHALPVTDTTLRSIFLKAAGVIAALFAMRFINALMNALGEIYKHRELAETKPLSGLFQIIKIVSFIICVLAGITVLLGQNPIPLIGGIGAVAAVITFVFKDAILGFAAGLQLINNDLLRIGDWIEMPKYNADGIVTEISMITVKVKNFDCSFTSIPAYSMISDSFINWRGMKESGGRRIKRSIHIDLHSVRFCDGEMLDRFEKIAVLSDHITNLRAEIDKYNKENKVDDSCVVNGRRATNIGVFRSYIQLYVERRPGIQLDKPVVVRQRASDRFGIPLEIIAYTNTVELAEYEKIQSDIFDHLYAVAEEFGLRIYQSQISLAAE